VQYGTDAARSLHDESPPIDLHADPLLWSRFFGYDLNKRHRPLPGLSLFGHVDVPRMIDGHMGAQFLGLVSLPALDRDCADACERQIDALDRAIEQSEGKLRLARTAEDVETAARDGVLGALLGIEGAHALDGSVDRLDAFARRGVRYLGLLHFSANDCGAPAFGVGADERVGLTQFGRNVVARCEELGVIVDLAHINRRGFMEACEMSTRAPIVSHTGVAGVRPLWRNIDDEQLRAVADRGGVAGVIFIPFFLGGSTLDAVASHIEHIVRVAGEDAPALGSDWDGFAKPVHGLEDASKLPLLTDRLLERGVMSRSAIAKLLRHNALRVLREVPPRS